MSNRWLSFAFFGLSLIILIAGTYLLKFYDCGVSTFCYNLITSSKALIYGGAALSIVFIILLFSPQSFTVWKKFAKWFIPIAALIFIFYPEPGSGDYFSPYPEQVFKWVSILYVFMSTIIIFRARKSATQI